MRSMFPDDLADRTSTTLDIYSHAFMKADEKAAVMDTIFKNATNKKA